MFSLSSKEKVKGSSVCGRYMEVHGNKAISISIFLVVSSLVKAQIYVYREFVVQLLELVCTYLYKLILESIIICL